MDRDARNIKIDLIFSLVILILCGIIQAEISKFFGEVAINSANLKFQHFFLNSIYVIAVITPLCIGFFFLMTMNFMLKICDIAFDIRELIVSIGFSFLPFLLNSTVLYYFLISDSNIDLKIIEIIEGRQNDVKFNDFITLNSFSNTGNISALLFTIILTIRTKLVLKIEAL
jgi:hypothetical protein